MKRKMTRSLLLAFVIVFLWITALPATETENLGIRVLPAPGKVIVDGKTDDWDLSAGMFTCGDVENRRDTMSTWFHAMYDANNLYVLTRWNDETPLNNPGQTIADYGFRGDCLQFRIITHPDDANERTSHWTCWRGRDGGDIMFVEYGKQLNEGNLKNAKMLGAQQALLINSGAADSTGAPQPKGYVQEIAVPWSLVLKEGQQAAEGGRADRPGDRAELHGRPKRPWDPERQLQTRGPAQPGNDLFQQPVLGLRHAGAQRPRRTVARALGRRARVSGETPAGPSRRGLDRTDQVQSPQRLQGDLVHHAGGWVYLAQYQGPERTARLPTAERRFLHQGHA